MTDNKHKSKMTFLHTREEIDEAYLLSARWNNSMLVFLCPIVTFLEIGLLIFDFFISKKDPELSVFSFEIFYLVMAVTSLIIYVINKVIKNKQERFAKITFFTTYFYCLFILLWSFFMTYADFSAGFSPSLGLFFVCITIIGSVFYLNPIIVLIGLFIMMTIQILTMVFIFKMPPKSLYMPNTYIFTLEELFYH